MPSRPALALPAAALAGLLLAGCAATDAGTTTTDDGPVEVLASFYPLQYVAEQVGGDLVSVSSLTPPGAEPHDVELSPAQVRGVGDTDLVVYLSGFQNAVDEAITARDPAHVVDAADHADLVGPEDGHATDEHADENTDEHANGAEDHAEDEHAHAEDGHTADDGHTEAEHAEAGIEVDAEAGGHTEDEAHTEDAHAHGELDPHFWLDPVRLAAVAGPVAESLAEIDPDNAATYTAAAERLVAELTELDTSFTEGLADCERRVVVTSHEAFGYLGLAYDLEQAGISGLDPEAEPSPARLRAIGDVVREEGVTTIYTETLVNPKVAETLAADLGVDTAVLDPIESLADGATDYRTVMEQNLAALQAGLGCA